MWVAFHCRPTAHGTCFSACECSSDPCMYSDSCTQIICDTGFRQQKKDDMCVQDLCKGVCLLNFAKQLLLLPLTGTYCACLPSCDTVFVPCGGALACSLTTVLFVTCLISALLTVCIPAQHQRDGCLLLNHLTFIVVCARTPGVKPLKCMRL